MSDPVTEILRNIAARLENLAPFKVKAKNLATGAEEEFQVTRNSDINSQEKAEQHVASLPKSVGGTHAGYEVIPASK